MNESEPGSKQRKSRLHRHRDDKLYLAFAFYGVVIFLLIKISYGSIGGYLLIATVAPLLTLIALIIFQVSTRPRPSPLAFVVVSSGILIIARWCLTIAGEASAAV